ncbi:GNAT family N-acetyltransferase [Streptomyces sp. ICN988]|uniref:GNAT family N-acetyltransferase n=1 Tax=Streptomyces sp. ICN988 TaxID=2983765 RepID=UPI0021E3E915|nr:GNAT family protein [Streptomyces sp. ICN988]MCV2458907.1 GNAT family N-acetyltransferase [Streptomyces sp. ICN988]
MDFSVKPVLTGDRTVLRPFTEADAERMWEIVNDPEVAHFTGAPPRELTPRVLRDWYGTRSAQPDRLDLAVTDPADGELLGEVVLHDWEPANRSCTFRTLIGPRGRGRGIGTEATRLIVGHAFEGLGLHRVQLDAYAHNHRALRVYEKVGFVREGVRREVEQRDGVWVDEVLMAVLDQEWAVHRGHPDVPRRHDDPRPGHPGAVVTAR